MADSPIILGYDPATLKERIDEDAATARLEEISHLRSLQALNERVTLLRLLGDVDGAYDTAQAAYRQSRFTGAREDALAARVRRGSVDLARGRAEDALRDLTGCVDEATAHEWSDLAAFALEERGRAHFENGDFAEALSDFERALDELGGPDSGRERVNELRMFIRTARDRAERTEQDRYDTTPLPRDDV